MQGYGLFMMEQLIHSPDGVLLTRGPGVHITKLFFYVNKAASK